MAKRKSIGDVLREAIKGTGKSAEKIAVVTGVPRPTITRFLAGADMRLSTAEKLAAYLGYELKQ
jgi:plasmid maintenance system antidote protein VapI